MCLHRIVVGTLLAFATSAHAADSEPAPRMIVEVDARDAPRRLLHSHVTLTVAPGPLVLLYPKWIPGEHGPTGPLNELAGLRITAAGHELPWRRDPLDLYRFFCEVPRGVGSVEISLDLFVPTSTSGFTGGASTTHDLAIINWNQLLLYPAGWPTDDLSATAVLTLPEGWTPATALPVARSGDARTEFRAVSLTTLVDSPVIAGANLRRVALQPDREIDLVADDATALAIPDSWTRGLSRLLDEAEALFGGPRFRSYRFLLTLSDQLGHFGLEHGASSDERVPLRTFLDDDLRQLRARLPAHELVHVWNGKYRRPLHQVARDFQQPRQTDLLWVYEGLTAYLGDVLTVRSGLWSPELFRGRLAQFAATLAGSSGRSWRPLVDTAVTAQLLYDGPREWPSLRRRVDVHSEGELLWLEVDVTIRRLTDGKRSLDDFCRSFFAGSGEPEVPLSAGAQGTGRPYSLDDLLAALDATAPFDWRRFFAERVDAPAASPPTTGLEGAGFRLAYHDGPNSYDQLVARTEGGVDLRFSLGLRLDDDGAIVDLLADSPAARAGLLPGGRLIAVDRRRWSPAQSASLFSGRGPTVELLVESDGYFTTYRLDRAAARHPHLDRDPARPDLLAAILRPRARRR